MWLLALQLFKNSIGTQEKLRLNLQSLSVSEHLEYSRKSLTITLHSNSHRLSSRLKGLYNYFSLFMTCTQPGKLSSRLGNSLAFNCNCKFLNLIPFPINFCSRFWGPTKYGNFVNRNYIVPDVELNLNSFTILIHSFWILKSFLFCTKKTQH
jgi:hypothetical protein